MKTQPGRFFIWPASQKVYRRKADDVRNGVAMRRMNTAVPFHGRHGRQERGKTFQYAFFPYRVFRALPQLYKSSHRRRHPAVTRCFPAPGRTVDMNRPLHHSHHRIVIVHQVGARDVAQPQPCMRTLPRPALAQKQISPAVIADYACISNVAYGAEAKAYTNMRALFNPNLRPASLSATKAAVQSEKSALACK